MRSGLSEVFYTQLVRVCIAGKSFWEFANSHADDRDVMLRRDQNWGWLA